MDIEDTTPDHKKRIYIKKKTLFLLLLTVFYFILFCSHTVLSLLESEPFHSFDVFYSLVILWQGITLTLHRNINVKSYNVFFYKVLIGIHAIELILLFIMLIFLPIFFSFIRFLYLIIGMIQSIAMFLLLSKNSRNDFFERVYYFNEHLAKKILFTLGKEIKIFKGLGYDHGNKDENMNSNNNNNNNHNKLENLNDNGNGNGNKFHLTITQSTFNPLNIQVQEITDDPQQQQLQSIPSRITVKSYDYSQERNSYIISNIEKMKENEKKEDEVKMKTYLNSEESYEADYSSMSTTKINPTFKNDLSSINPNQSAVSDDIPKNLMTCHNKNNEIELISVIPSEDSEYTKDITSSNHSSSIASSLTPSNHLLSPITQTTQPSHASSLITPSIHLSQSTSYMTSSIPSTQITNLTSQPYSVIRSSNPPPPHSQPFSSSNPTTMPPSSQMKHLLPLASSSSSSSTEPFVRPSSISPTPNNLNQPVIVNANTNEPKKKLALNLQPSFCRQQTPYKRIKRVNHFYKLFLFLIQFFYIIILVMLFCRTSLYYYDRHRYLTVFPGQMTNINNNSHRDGGGGKKAFSLHIQCSGQGPVTVLFESGLFISSSLLWSETFNRSSNITKSCSFPRTQDQEEKELTELLKQSNLDGPFILVSHSYGSLISTSFAIHNKDKILGMILIEPFFATPDFIDSNFLLNNFVRINSDIYWSGFSSAINFDILSISSMEEGIGLPMDILLSNPKEKVLLRNINLYKTVYSELTSYKNNILNLNQSSSIENLKENIKDIPVRVIVGDRVLAANECNKMFYDTCDIKSKCNSNYKQLIESFCDWENCELRIADNCEHYVPLERLDMVITSIYNFLK
ncbi:hypothetical protein LY90DRAFT_504238 [Neocallimastix californiae]|uniref:AB hydrolase-1 domain-containing protein n=1 Tax=Neocallimastix californiae TaxID=1754190 RepID=A0A1Y2ECU1_9FUNG|nr:hypothetical protein LY90DRAFT_504238 [Neocallimastix californiae]|eukprot:ORY69391.1 hypothetical protein LY90DRAFT_504238 [Neocallimastix californiae]